MYMFCDCINILNKKKIKKKDNSHSVSIHDFGFFSTSLYFFASYELQMV